MQLSQILQILDGSVQYILVGLVIWLIWIRSVELRESRRFQRDMDAKMQALNDYMLHRMIDSAMPLHKGDD